jgi:hypothetical protein
MNTIEIGKVKVLTPASWNELTRKQLVYIAELFDSKFTLIDFKVRVLKAFLSLKRKISRQISHEDAYFLTETLDFLFKPVNLTKNLIPTIKISLFRKLYGPADKMMTSTFGEFIKAHTRFELYEKNKTAPPETLISKLYEEKDAFLNEMVAILYRPKKVCWWIRRYFTDKTDCRVPFMDRTLFSRTKDISKIDKKIRFSVYLFFSGILGSLPEQFPNLYRKKDDQDEKKTGWADLIISLADDHMDDESLDRVMNSNLYNVLIGLEKKSAEYFRFREEHPDLFKD